MIALGLSQSFKGNVFCIDGDGSSIMHMGNITSIGQSNNENLIHVVLNNGSHDSVGGQPTCANEIIYLNCKSVWLQTANSVSRLKQIKLLIKKLKESIGPHFLEIKIKKVQEMILGGLLHHQEKTWIF